MTVRDGLRPLERDVIVVGAGGAGLATAVAAAHQGLDVLVVEKSAFYGGATAWSGGNVWAPANSLLREKGEEDCQGDALAYLEAVVGEHLDPDLARAFLDAVPQMVDFFQYRTPVKFQVQSRFADHYPGMPGACRTGRCLTPVPYDGRKLGPALRHLREPLEQVNAPFGMMIDYEDVDHLRDMTQSVRSLWYVAGMLMRLLWDKLRHARGTRLTMGNALVARLVRAALDSGVEIQLETSARQLVHGAGRVTGVIAEHRGRPRLLKARRGVVLATGGFSADETLRRQFIPFPEQHVSLMPDENDGSGIRMGLNAGGSLGEGNRNNADWVVVSVGRKSDGSSVKCLHTVLDRPKPGCIAINRAGQRFCNEAARDMVEAMHRTSSVPAYLICDSRFIKKYGLGLVKPGGLGLKSFLASGYLIKAADVAELAALTGVDHHTLQGTIDRFNQLARQGHDQDFGRGNSDYDRTNGDHDHAPNPCLGPLDKPPYYGVKIYPGDASTWVGLRIDSRTRVLDGKGVPVAGLHAVGLDAHSLWRGTAPSLGSNNTLSLTLGYITAMTLADCC